MTTEVTVINCMQALIDAAERYCVLIENEEHKQHPDKTYSLNFLGITKISDVDITFNYTVSRCLCCQADQSDEWISYDRLLELDLIKQDVYDMLKPSKEEENGLS